MKRLQMIALLFVLAQQSGCAQHDHNNGLRTEGWLVGLYCDCVDTLLHRTPLNGSTHTYEDTANAMGYCDVRYFNNEAPEMKAYEREIVVRFPDSSLMQADYGLQARAVHAAVERYDVWMKRGWDTALNRTYIVRWLRLERSTLPYDAAWSRTVPEQQRHTAALLGYYLSEGAVDSVRLLFDSTAVFKRVRGELEELVPLAKTRNTYWHIHADTVGAFRIFTFTNIQRGRVPLYQVDVKMKLGDYFGKIVDLVFVPPKAIRTFSGMFEQETWPSSK